jgi:uncharacterized iron-regulated membrane protein
MSGTLHGVESVAENPVNLSPDSTSQEAEVDDRPSRRASASIRLYSVIWRWHFYAGLITAPILWLVTITGALYVFRTELTSWRDRAWLEVDQGSQRMSYDKLREVAARALGTEELDAILVRGESGRSVRFTADAEGPPAHGAEHRHRHVYVDPYQGTVLGSRVEEEDFFAIVLDLHRSLMLGTQGRILTELATGWAIALLATGVYLWWPRGKSNVGVWAPRVRGRLYAVLRDWHAVVGFYFVPLSALVAVTGLFFTAVWGTGFNTTAQKAGHWPSKWFAVPKSSPRSPDASPAPLDRVVATVLAQSRPGDGAMIRLGLKPDDAYKAWLMRDEDKNSLRMVNVDQYTAEPLEMIDSTDVPFLYRVRLWAVSIHMGQIFGTPTKILALASTLIVFGLSVTGTWMWWRRRPPGRAGFPRRPPSGIVPKWGWLVVGTAGFLMPVVGVSILLISLLDFVATSFLQKRVKMLETH